MKRCKVATRYKAIVPPRCNSGDPCEACLAKWYKANPAVCAYSAEKVIEKALKLSRDSCYDALEAWQVGDFKSMHDIFNLER